MSIRDEVPAFTLTGGVLYRLGLWTRLVRSPGSAGAMGLVIGALLWIVLVILALAEGRWEEIFSLSAVAVHVRLLLVIPLMFLCETVVAPKMADFVAMIVRSEIVPESSLRQLGAEIDRVRRRSASGLPEALCLAAAVMLALYGPQVGLGGLGGLTGEWYATVCMVVFRFLVLRWLWRLLMWCWFLWRLSRLSLRLVPTHPDRAGGLGYLEVVHTQFLPLVVAISATQAAIYAEQIHAGTLALETVYPAVAILFAIDAVLFILPLGIFAPALWECRNRGLADYMAFAAHYVHDFDRKWLGSGGEPRSELLGSGDLQSLADLGNSMGAIREMRWLPVSSRLLTEYAVAALVPLAPLLLFKYPLIELVQRVVAGLTGL